MSNVDELWPPSFKVATLSFRARSGRITLEPFKYPHSFIANLRDIKHFFGCGL